MLGIEEPSVRVKVALLEVENSLFAPADACALDAVCW